MCKSEISWYLEFELVGVIPEERSDVCVLVCGTKKQVLGTKTTYPLKIRPDSRSKYHPKPTERRFRAKERLDQLILTIY